MSGTTDKVAVRASYVLRTAEGTWLAAFDYDPDSPWAVWSAVRARAFAFAEKLKADGVDSVLVYSQKEITTHTLVATV